MMPPLSMVTCGKCNTPVARVTSYASAITRELVFVVECHGEVDRVRIPREALIGAETVELRPWVAFVDRLASCGG